MAPLIVAVLAELAAGKTEIIRLSAAERKVFAAATAPLIDVYREEMGPDVFKYLRRRST